MVTGLLPPAATTDARYRMYSAAEIWRLELVRSLRAFGFGLEDVRVVEVSRSVLRHELGDTPDRRHRGGQGENEDRDSPAT